MTPSPFSSHKKRFQPIPDQSTQLQLKQQGIKCPIDDKDPRFLEELVDLSEYGIAGDNHYHLEWNPPYYHSIPGSIPELLARKTVAEKLASINDELKGLGIEIYVFDSYRPQSVQKYFSQQWFPEYLREKYPDQDENWIEQEVSDYWAMGASTLEALLKKIPPHSTGGAVDMTLRHIESGFLLEMGSLFDDVTSVSHTRHFEDFLNQGQNLGFTDVEALKNRRFLHHLMIEAGFTSLPTEWWHFSYGDQMWAAFSGHDSAFYSYAGKMAGEALP